MDTIIKRLQALTKGEGRIVGYMAYNAANECIGYTENHAATVGADFLAIEISELIDGNPWRVCQACGQPSVEAFCTRPECLTHGSGAVAAGPSIVNRRR